MFRKQVLLRCTLVVGWQPCTQEIGHEQSKDISESRDETGRAAEVTAANCVGAPPGRGPHCPSRLQ